MSKAKAKDAPEEPNFQIRPPFSQKFKPGAVKVWKFLILIELCLLEQEGNKMTNGTDHSAQILIVYSLYRCNIKVNGIIKYGIYKCTRRFLHNIFYFLGYIYIGMDR